MYPFSVFFCIQILCMVVSFVCGNQWVAEMKKIDRATFDTFRVKKLYLSHGLFAYPKVQSYLFGFDFLKVGNQRFTRISVSIILAQTVGVLNLLVVLINALWLSL